MLCSFFYYEVPIKFCYFSFFHSQVVFEGRRGISWAGDIALDDISIQDGQCPVQLQCSFENPQICGWTNVHGDNFDWTRANGYTASIGTGPAYDHTTGTSSGKVFVLKSLLRAQNNSCSKDNVWSERGLDRTNSCMAKLFVWPLTLNLLNIIILS